MSRNYDSPALSFGLAATFHGGLEYPVRIAKERIPARPAVLPLPLRMFRECPRAKMAKYNRVMGTDHPLPKENAKTWRETLGTKRSS